MGVKQPPSTLRVLLIPDAMDWALGTIAKQIITHTHSFDFYLLTELQISRDSKLLWGLLPWVDVVHFLNPHAFLEFAGKVERPSVLSVHHVMNDGDVGKFLQADVILVHSQEWRGFLSEKGVPEEKLSVVRYGVDSSVFHPYDEARKRKTRRRFNVPPGSFVVGFVAKASSNERDRKGVDVFLEALKKVSYGVRDLCVLVVGPGWQDVVSTMESCGYQVCTEPFYHHEMADVYNAMDVYVVTSTVEGGPMTVLESMSCGVPTIATPVGLVPEILVDGMNGFIVPKRDPAAVADRILRIAKSGACRKTLRLNGRASVLDEWQWSRTLEPLSHFYLDVFANSSRARIGNGVPPNAGREAKFPIPRQQRLEAVWRDKLVWAECLGIWNERRYAREVVMRAVIQRPWRLDAWKILTRDYGPPQLTRALRRIRRLFDSV